MYGVEKIFDIHGKKADMILLKNQHNMEVKLLNYGAGIVDILVPDRRGTPESVVLTYENIEDYIDNPSYFGVTVGRTSGRIAKGSFHLDGKIYGLEKNAGVNHIHGGPKGFSFQVWDYEIQEKDTQTKVIFRHMSKDMEENYPGNLQASVTYTLTEANELMIEYEAESDQNTLCNLTNHAYFNLSGNYRRKVTEQHLRIDADSFLELDQHQTPTGKVISVEDTPMDFRKRKSIGQDIQRDYEQLVMAGGYDHVWLLNGGHNQIEMMDEDSGRKMVIDTTYPSVVIYSYNYPKNEKLKYDKIGSLYDGICFEAQYEPDGIHHEDLNSGILEKGKAYYERTIFKFSVV